MTGTLYGDGPNLIIGSTENRNGADIASDLASSILLNPGAGSGQNNIIGGDGSATVGTGTENTTQVGTNASVSVVGGYDSVAGSLSSKIIADHSYTEVGGVGHNSIFGGANHIIRTEASFSHVAGGYANVIEAAYSFATGLRNTITGGGNARVSGADNTVSAVGSTADGANNIVSGSYARAHGTYNVASGHFSEAKGQRSVARFPGQQAFTGGMFAVQGDSQVSQMEMHRATTDAATYNLGFNGGNAAYQLQPNQSANYEANIVARVVGGTDSAAWRVTGCYRRGATGTPATVGTPTITAIGADAGAAAWTVAVIADSAGGINMRITGEAGKTIRWVQRFEVVEVTV